MALNGAIRTMFSAKASPLQTPDEVGYVSNLPVLKWSLKRVKQLLLYL
ncbi:MAG: hypothetical protein JWR14_2437 [Caballeronia sp.]|jgi:hypothetical protein|nr:hypothetical protein [Caballeronia sp.]